MGFADKIKAFFRRSALDSEVFEDLTDLLVEGDLGAALSYEIVDKLKEVCRKEKINDLETAQKALKEILASYTLHG